MAVVLGGVVLGESIGVITIISGAMILIPVALILSSRIRATRQAPVPSVDAAVSQVA